MDWLISNGFAANRLEAVTLASVLMEENFLSPVGVRSTGAIRSGDLAKQFLDDSTALYTFVSYGACSSWHQPRGKEEARGFTILGFGRHLHLRGVGFCTEDFPFPCGSCHSPTLGLLVTESLLSFPLG